MISDKARFDQAIPKFDAANAEDPNKEVFEGKEYPKELLYAQRMTDMLKRFAPDAPEHVQLAAHAQHICRWKVPRSDYPMDKAGYYQWRTYLYKFHGETAGAIMQEAGSDEETISKLKALLRKERNPEQGARHRARRGDAAGLSEPPEAPIELVNGNRGGRNAPSFCYSAKAT